MKLRTGWLTGSGTIRANGAWSDSPNYGGAGGGGRIAIVLTGGDFSTWTGTNMARSTAGSGQSADSYGAAGTVYRQAAGVPDGAGIVFVDNGAIATNASFTSLPALSNQTENLRLSSWVVTNTTRLGLTTNCTIASLNLSTANSTLELGGWTLTVGALTVTNTVYSTGTYTPSEISRLTDAVGGGKVVVTGPPAGTMFLFR
ncbi:MAG: hypothetical protein FJ225_02545 [Lentisphaerae bacterium]|nr:hypothetical protein [Lentisphaerota bacterium]